MWPRQTRAYCCECRTRGIARNSPCRPTCASVSFKVPPTNPTTPVVSTITGSLLLDVAEPKGYNEIMISFIGRSYVHWTESHSTGSGRNRRTTTRSYTSSESYVNLVAPLWNKQQSPDGKLAPGQYNWPFSFIVPPTAPSSFEGTVGNIRYSLVGKIATGLLKFDHNVELRIPVQQLVKITDPRLLQPVRQEVQKTVCCLCCASGPIVLTAALPKTGFVVGESFQLHVSLQNGSNRRVTMNANITQRVVYYAQGHRRFSGKTFVSVGSDQIEPQASRDWDPTITIPTTDMSIIHETSCRNISVTYTLSVVGKIQNALDLAMTFPLQLGNCRDEQSVVGAPPALQPGPPQQPQAAYPPPAQPGPNQPPAAYPTAPPGSGAPPPYASGSGPQAETNFGWSAVAMSDFPPPEPQETLSDFSAAQIEKGLK